MASTQSIDSKLQTLFDNYQDKSIVSEAQADVEGFRKRQILVGLGATGAIFLTNELSRFAFRSRKYILAHQ